MKTESEKVRLYLFAVFGLFLMASMSLAVSFARFTHAGSGVDGRVIVAGLAGLVTFVSLVWILARILRAYTGLERRMAREIERLSAEAEKERKKYMERIEERTFELASINASLNRQIAERIQAGEDLKKLTRQMELILNAAGDGIFGLDWEGRVIFVNTSASIMLGWEPQELIGKNHHEIVHHTRADGTPYPHEECPIEAAYREGMVRFATGEIFWRKDGTSFQVEYVSTPIMEDDRVTGAVVVFRDVTDR